MAYKDLTFEQYAKEVYKILKEEYAVAKAYPKEFEEAFKDAKVTTMREDFESGRKPSSVAWGISYLI